MANWRVDVGYVGLDKEWHWGCMARSDKAKVKAAFNKFRQENRTRLFKDGRLVCEVNGPEVINDQEAWKEFCSV